MLDSTDTISVLRAMKKIKMFNQGTYYQCISGSNYIKTIYISYDNIIQ